MAKKKNPAAKRRDRTNPYASWTHPRLGWKYKLLKSNQTDNTGVYAIWHVEANGDMGDAYVTEVRPGMLSANDLVFDTTVWATKEDFRHWATGS